MYNEIYNIIRSCIIIKEKVLTRNVPQYFKALYHEVNNQINSTITFKQSFDQRWFYEQKNENTFEIVLNPEFEDVDFWVKLLHEYLYILQTEQEYTNIITKKQDISQIVYYLNHLLRDIDTIFRLKNDFIHCSDRIMQSYVSTFLSFNLLNYIIIDKKSEFIKILASILAFMHFFDSKIRYDIFAEEYKDLPYYYDEFISIVEQYESNTSKDTFRNMQEQIIDLFKLKDISFRKCISNEFMYKETP